MNRANATSINPLHTATDAPIWKRGSNGPINLKRGVPLRYQEKNEISTAPTINKTGNRFIIPTIDRHIEAITAGQKSRCMKTDNIKVNPSFLTAVFTLTDSVIINYVPIEANTFTATFIY